MKKFNVGIQLFGVRKSLAEDFEGTIRALAEMGYEYVEFAGYYGKSAEEILNILNKYGLRAVSVHQKLDFFAEDREAAAEFLKGFGIKYVMIPWYNKNALAGSPEWEKTAAYFNEMADFFKSKDMMLGYHNHDFEFEKVEGKYIHDYIFEAVPADKIVPEIDTCWVRYAGLSPEEKLRQFKGRVPIVHLKDFTCKNFAGGPVYDLIGTGGGAEKKATIEENEFKFRPLGMGVQNFAPILEACEECGCEIVIVEQDQTYEMSELEAAKISREYLKNTFGI